MSEGSSGDLHVSYPGMTLRDYFAGQALIGIAWDCGYSHAEAADTAYSFADAMIARRKTPVPIVGAEAGQASPL